MKTVLIAFAAAALFVSPVLADAPSAATSDAGAAPNVETKAAETKPAETKPVEVKKPKSHREASHQASWHNGHGSTWREGSNKYGFSGRYGGCMYHGSAGTWGYHLEKSC